jgi:molybdate transport system substrate-binding protein
MRSFLLFFSALLFPIFAHAQTLKILTAGAFKQVAAELVTAFEAAHGVKIEMDNGTAGQLLKRINGGEQFDVLFLTPGGLSELARAGKIEAASVKNVAKVAIGVAVKSGVPLPPIATVEEFKQAILQAKKVAYIDPASGGSSGIYLDGLFKRLGISEQVKAKAVLVPGGYAAERVANGEADLAIHQVSEILPVKGVALVGLLPAEIQNFTTYGFGISTESKNQALAKKFLGSIAGAGVAEMIRSKGMAAVLE